MTTSTIAHPTIVSRDQWLAQRKKLLADEKELTRHYDTVNLWHETEYKNAEGATMPIILSGDLRHRPSHDKQRHRCGPGRRHAR